MEALEPCTLHFGPTLHVFITPIVVFSVSYITTPSVSTLYDDRTINNCGAVGGMMIGRGN
jgi:hypothetical protein